VRTAQAGKLATIGGDVVDVRNGDRVAYDVVDTNRARLVCTFTEKLPNVAAWRAVLADAKIAPTRGPKSNPDGSIDFEIAAPDAVAATGQKLTDAKLTAARVEPVRGHTETTWSALRGKALPAGADVVSVFVTRPIPDDAYAIVDGEKPDTYWYVTWELVAIIAIGLLFAWSLVRAVRRDLLPVRV
jgi:hypothetical protein